MKNPENVWIFKTKMEIFDFEMKNQKLEKYNPSKKGKGKETDSY